MSLGRLARWYHFSAYEDASGALALLVTRLDHITTTSGGVRYTSR